MSQSLTQTTLTTAASATSYPDTTGPYRWQTTFPARVLRRALRQRSITRYVDEACAPLAIQGIERLDTLVGPAIIIANHSSHLDSLVLAHSLREQVRPSSSLAADAAA